MNREVVKICTNDNQGNGIILPCKFNDNDANYYYIVLTAAHVLENITDIKNNNDIEITVTDYKKSQVVFSNKKLINNSVYYMKIIDYYKEKKDKESSLYYDVSALLLKSNYNLNIPKLAISMEYSENMKVIGYPNSEVVEDREYQMVLYGNSLPFKPNDNRQLLKLKDEYNSNYKFLTDKCIFEGFSGAPIYNKSQELIGMLTDAEGTNEQDNPFRVFKFYEIASILEYLYDKACIVYNIENKIPNIIWSKGSAVFSEGEDLSLLVLGSSGAGKSSFINRFCKNRKLIDGTGDGQTTRNDIYYNLSLHSEKTSVQIEFLNEKKFTEKMFNLIRFEIIDFLFNKILDFNKYDYLIDRHKILFKINNFLNLYKDFYSEAEYDSGIKYDNAKISKLIKKIAEIVNNEKLDSDLEDDLFDLYIDILNILNELKQEHPFLINALNYDSLNDIISYFKNKTEGKSPSTLDDELINWLNEVDYNVYGDKIEIGNEERDELICCLLKYVKEEKVNEKKININNINKKYEDFYKIINHIDGYFSLKEFLFLYDKDEEYIKDKGEEHLKNSYEDFLKNEYEGFLKEKFETFLKDDDINIIDNCQQYHSPVNNERNLKEEIISYYSKIYKYLIRLIEAYYNENNLKEIIIDLSEMDDIKNSIIQYSMKIHEGNSISSLIESIKIEDIISEEYSYIFYKMNLRKITFIDSMGLDHTTKNKDYKTALRNYIDAIELKDSNKNQKNSINAILYTKKLDAGKPTEIIELIEEFYLARPDIPLYLVFTGIDIYYNKSDFFEPIVWKNNLNNINNKILPKNVEFIFSEECENLINKLSPYKWKNNVIHTVLRDNICAFTSIENGFFINNEYLNSNQINIRKVCLSILLKENETYRIVSNLRPFETDEFKAGINNFILNLFKRSSIYNWHSIHHKTRGANYRRIFTDRDFLGYFGTYRHRWDLLFSDAYIDTVNDDIENIIKLFEETDKTKIQSIMQNLRLEFLGKGLNKINTDEIEEDCIFRNILRKMYEYGKGQKLYSFNPFEIEKDENSIGEAAGLNDVYDFYKGIDKYPQLLDELVNYYIKIFNKKIREENEKLINKKFKIEPELYYKFSTFIENFKYSFSIQNGEESKDEFFKTLNNVYDVIIKDN